MNLFYHVYSMEAETTVVAIGINDSFTEPQYSPVTSSSSKNKMDTLDVTDVCPELRFKSAETQTDGVNCFLLTIF